MLKNFKKLLTKQTNGCNIDAVYYKQTFATIKKEEHL